MATKPAARREGLLELGLEQLDHGLDGLGGRARVAAAAVRHEEGVAGARVEAGEVVALTWPSLAAVVPQQPRERARARGAVQVAVKDQAAGGELHRLGA